MRFLTLFGFLLLLTACASSPNLTTAKDLLETSTIVGVVDTDEEALEFTRLVGTLITQPAFEEQEVSFYVDAYADFYKALDIDYFLTEEAQATINAATENRPLIEPLFDSYSENESSRLPRLFALSGLVRTRIIPKDSTKLQLFNDDLEKRRKPDFERIESFTPVLLLSFGYTFDKMDEFSSYSSKIDREMFTFFSDKPVFTFQGIEGMIDTDQEQDLLLDHLSNLTKFYKKAGSFVPPEEAMTDQVSIICETVERLPLRDFGLDAYPIRLLRDEDKIIEEIVTLMDKAFEGDTTQFNRQMTIAAALGPFQTLDVKTWYPLSKFALESFEETAKSQDCMDRLVELNNFSKFSILYVTWLDGEY